MCLYCPMVVSLIIYIFLSDLSLLFQGLSNRVSDEPRIKQGGQGRGGRGASGGYSSNFPGTISPPF